MSFTADFYTSGPYLHNPPTKGYVDRYLRALGGQGMTELGDKIENMTIDAVAGLRRRAADAAKIEGQFYDMFGVKSANEWSDKYLLSRGAGAWSQDDITKYWEATSINGKTIAAINTQENRNLLRGDILEGKKNHTKLLKLVRQINTKAVQAAAARGVKTYITKRKTHDALVSMLLRGNNIEHLFSKMMKGHQGLLQFESIIVQAKATKLELTYKLIEEGIIDEVSDALNHNFSSGVSQTTEGRELQRFIRNAEKGGFGNVDLFLDAVRANLTSSLTIEDFGFKIDVSETRHQFESERDAYIEGVMDGLFKYLVTDVKKLDIDFFDNVKKIPGGLGEFSTEIIIQRAVRDIDPAKMKGVRVESVGDHLATNKRLAQGGKQLPVDLRIAGRNPKGQEIFYNIQIKNYAMDSKAGFDRLGLQMHQGDVHVGMPKNMSSFLADVGYTEILDTEQIEILAYKIVNESYRGEKDGLTAVSNLLNFVVEHMVKSATAKAMFENETYKTAGATIIQEGDVIGNHFILLHGRRLIGMSSFLYAAANLLDGRGVPGGKGTDMYRFPAMKPNKDKSNMFMANTDVVEGSALRQEKKDQAGDTQWYEGQRYGEPVLSVGRKYGNDIIGRMPSPDVQLSIIHIINQINNLIS